MGASRAPKRSHPIAMTELSAARQCKVPIKKRRAAETPSVRSLSSATRHIATAPHRRLGETLSAASAASDPTRNAGGDVHQPPHVSFEDDRGGSSIGISGGLCGWDLHAVWDRCIIEQGLPGDPYALARQLLGEMTDEERAARRVSTPTDWAKESFAISTSPSVGYCVRTDDGCWYGPDNERLDQGEPETTVVVDQPYIETQAPTVRKQLLKAGGRLAGLLTRALGD